MTLNIIHKIFPVFNIKDNLLSHEQLKPEYDVEGLWSITYPDDANYISEIIKNEIGINSIIMDATAGIGGNTISFAKYFNSVVSIELNKLRFDILQNNINIYNLSNVQLINGDCINYLTLNYDGIFFDPPWGGPDYKYKKKLKIKLGEYTLEKICYKIIKTKNKLIFIKLPFNYDLSEFVNFNYKITKIKNYQLLTIYECLI
jgi:16S rRNA G966 N2-methylase RsmD